MESLFQRLGEVLNPQTDTKPITSLNLSKREIEDLQLIRNHFGKNDKTTFDHFAFACLDKLLKKLI